MSHSPKEYLRHIRDEITYLEGKSDGLSKDDFLRDETIRRAFVRSLEVMAKRRKSYRLNFERSMITSIGRAIAGMRDNLIHGYFGVDYDIVWDVVLNEIPELRRTIEDLLDTGRAG